MTEEPRTQEVRDDGDSASAETPAKAPLHTSPDCSPPDPPPTNAEPTANKSRNSSHNGKSSSHPPSPSSAEREAKLKAEARAYALSGSTNEGKSKPSYKRKLHLGGPPSASAPSSGSHTVATTHRKPNKLPTQTSRPPKRARLTSTTALPTSKSSTKSTMPPSMPTKTTNYAAASSTGKPVSKPRKEPQTLLPKGPLPPATTAQLPPKAPPPRAATRKAPTAPPVVIAGGPLATTGVPKGAAKLANSNPATPLLALDRIDKDYDPEYLKLIQSLGELDDFSIWDNLDNVEDEEFRLSDLEDECDDEEEDEFGDDETSSDKAAATMAKDAAAALPGTPQHPSGTKASSASNPPKSPNVVTDIPATLATPSKDSSLLHNGISSPSLDLPGWDDEQEDGGEFYKNLEEELGSLLEEELEAAVQSLYTSKGKASDNDKKKKKKATPATTKPTAEAPSGPLQLPAGTIVATAGTGNSSSSTPVTAATLAAEAKRKKLAAETKKSSKGANANNTAAAPDTPLRETARQGNSATVTYQQSQQLRKLMRKHYQLLTQQAILSVRAAQAIKNGDTPVAANKYLLKGGKARGSSPKSSASGSGGGDFLSGENETELTEILDLAVGMLQDLDQNRKDAILTSIQLATSVQSGSIQSRVTKHNTSVGRGNANPENSNSSSGDPPNKGARRSLLSQFAEDSLSPPDGAPIRPEDVAKAAANPKVPQGTSQKEQKQAKHETNASLNPASSGSGRLTRAAFRKLQSQPIAGSKRTAFDIPGLLKLNETFSTIDDSVNVGPQPTPQASNGHKKVNIIEAATHAQACRDVLKDAGANVEEALLPGVLDVSENFSQLEEHLGDDFQPPCSPEQEQFLRKNRNLFTSGEDNLVMRGVNLYGEKQWILIGDRYLPDRSVNIVSQRYSKLCVMLYKASGIYIDNEGKLLEPPKLESVDDIDEEKVKAMGLKLVDPPAILNVHRWSMEEDLTILKAVPIMGHMWAELGARLIPHRDRGHLRKRYQVLERRVKSTINRSFKAKAKARGSTYRTGSVKSKCKLPVKAAPKILTKATVATANAKALSSPTRKGKKSSSPAGSPSKTKSKASPGRAKAGGAGLSIDTNQKILPAGEPSSSPQLSNEGAAAVLACIKPKETEKQANANLQSAKPKAAASTKPPTKLIAKRPTLHRVYPPAKGQEHPEPAGADDKTTKYAPPYQYPPAGDKNVPHGHPQHPYSYHYGYQGYYHPAYQYPPHAAQHPNAPSTEKNKNHPPPPPYPGAKHYYTNYPPESKRFDIASPKPSSRPLPKDMDTPNSKSFMATFPKLLDHISSYGGDGETSRQACEKLFEFVNEGSKDSPFSRVKKMLDNEEESEAANAIVSHLAKSPGRGGFSNLLPDTNSITGLSILNETSKGASPSKDGLSIMARVFGKSSDNQKESSDAPSPSRKPAKSDPKSFGSPAKKKKGSALLAAPQTPQGRGLSSSHFFSPTNGTPLAVGLSPGLRTLGASALLKPDGPKLPVPFSPAPSALLKTEALATNLSVPYSPAPSMLFRAFDEKTADENNHFAPFDQDSRVCEDSNQLGDLAVGADLSNNGNQTNGNSLIIAPEEFDAISGLGALSNSPFKTVKSLSQRDGDDAPANSEKKKKKSKSFFARVVGDSKETSPKKKLNY